MCGCERPRLCLFCLGYYVEGMDDEEEWMDDDEELDVMARRGKEAMANELLCTKHIAVFKNVYGFDYPSVEYMMQCSPEHLQQ